MAMENEICCPKSASTNLAMHRKSQTISKSKPKIRIIHIFAPEIIKTEVANFRELVQRLTGKPDPSGAETKEGSRKKKARTEVAAGFHADILERVKEEIWMSANSGGGFLGGFTEIEGFMHELNHFQFLEGTTAQAQGVYGDQCLQLA
ncbi:VQ motif-containing protein 17-like [Salvia divinorum]|uniref:VQ motif-containing protein 17-like n=1 Tax=Salvia divinorum TaxID=28513 RepID=A0ABD1H1C2_SALDI